MLSGGKFKCGLTSAESMLFGELPWVLFGGFVHRLPSLGATSGGFVPRLPSLDPPLAGSCSPQLLALLGLFLATASEPGVLCHVMH